MLPVTYAETLTVDPLTLNECTGCHTLKLGAIFERNSINVHPSYSDLKIESLLAVRHLGFQGAWIARPSSTSNERIHQI